MARIHDVTVRFNVDTKDLDKAQRQFGQVNKNVKGAQGNIQNLGTTTVATGSKMSSSLKALGGVIAATFSIAVITSFGRSIINLGKDFTKTMSRVGALTNATGQEFKQLENLAKQLGETTQFSATQAAEAMTFLAQAGLKTNDILEALPGTLELAASGQLDLATSADIATNVLAAYSLQASDLNQINDLLIATTSKANVNVVQFSEAFKLAGPIAKSAGVDINEAAAIIGELGNAGIQGSLGGTALRGVISSLISPSKEAAKTLKELGIETKDANGELLPLSDIFEQLQNSTVDAADFFTIFGERAASAASVLTNAGGNIADFADILKNDVGIAGKIASQQMDNLEGDSLALSSAIEGQMLKVFEELGPTLRDVTQQLTALTRESGGLTVALGELLAGTVKELIQLLMDIKTIGGAIVDLFSSIGDAVGGLSEKIGIGNTRIGEFIGWLTKLSNPIEQSKILFRSLAETIGLFNDEADKASETTQTLQERVAGFTTAEQFIDLIGEMAANLEVAKERFGENSEFVVKYSEALQFVQDALTDFLGASEETNTELEDIGKNTEDAATGIDLLKERLAELEKQLINQALAGKISNDTLNEYLDIVKQITEAETLLNDEINRGNQSREDRLRLEREQINATIERVNKAKQAEFDAQNEIIDRIRKATEEYLAGEQRKRDAAIATVNATLAAAQGLSQSIGQIYANSVQAQSQAIDAALQNQLNDLQAQRDAELITEERFQAERTQLERQAADQRKQLLIEEAQFKKNLARAEALIGIASAIVENLDKPFAIAAAAALGAAQLAVIETTPIPQFSEGVIGLQAPGQKGKDSVLSMLAPGESVMTAQETDQYNGVLKSIRAGTFDTDYMPRQELIMPKYERQVSFAENMAALVNSGDKETNKLLKQIMRSGDKNADKIVTGLKPRQQRTVRKRYGV